MMKCFIALSLILCFFSATKSFALRENARRVLTKAVAGGLVDLDGINLLTVLKKIDQIEIETANTQIAGRTSAIWQPMRVIYNPTVFSAQTLIVQDVLAVHEIIGAITQSWKDDGYSHSLYIWMVANKNFFKPLLSSFVWSDPKRNKHVFEVAGGGSTTVRGGGDVREIDLKIDGLLCLKTYAESGGCLLSRLEKPVAQVTKGLLFANWYVVSETKEGRFNLHIPKDKSIQTVALVHPRTYQMILNSLEIHRAHIMIELAVIFSDWI